jgi:SlyX protein
MADEKAVTDRLVEIEAKLALAEDLLDEVNRTVFRQQQLIDRLQQELRALQEVVESGADAGEARGPRDEIPPHY